MKSSVWILVSAVAYTLLGYLVMAVVLSIIESLTADIFSSLDSFFGREALQIFVFLGALAFGVAAALCWWLLVVRSGRLTAWRGMLTGALSGLLMHVFLWLLSSLYLLVINPEFNFSDLLGALLYFTPVSLLVFGWISVPAGALLGWPLIMFQRSLMGSNHA